jgi:uncharacterized protein YchJ
MVTKKNIIIVCIVIAGGLAAFFILFQSDEAKIKKRFKEMSEQVEKEGNEHDILAAAAARKIENMFTGSVHIEIPSYSVSQSFPKGEISPHALYARAQFNKMTLKFRDVEIEFPEENRAVVSVTGIFKAITKANERVDEVHEVECSFKKIEDEWFFSGITQVEVLER